MTSRSANLVFRHFRRTSAHCSAFSHPLGAKLRAFIDTRSLSTSLEGQSRLNVPTVFAVATSTSKAAISIIRLSGPQAKSTLKKLIVGKDCAKLGKEPQARLLELHKLRDPASGTVLDHAMTAWFPGPHSYTGEDMVELHVHGGRATVQAIQRTLAEFPGLVPAQPGEFTRRAFLNGKMDLTEVEGLADLLNADTEAQRQLALNQLDGGLKRRLMSWRAEIVGCLAHAEAVIDFGEDEEDCNDEVYRKVESRIRTLVEQIQRQLQDGRRGEILRDGIQVAIIGPPNAGKSSLLNVIAKRPAAIVSSIPGTTRDVIEVSLDLGGYPVVLSDTAGIRESSDPVEAEGIHRALHRGHSADLRLFVFDASVLDDADSHPIQPFLSLLSRDTPSFVVLNKADLIRDKPTTLPSPLRALKQFVVSCADHTGIDAFLTSLEEAVKSRFEVNSDSVNGNAMITRERHRFHVQACLDALQRFLARPGQVDMAAEELRLAAHSLGVVTGRVDVEELLDIVFRDFCIGK